MFRVAKLSLVAIPLFAILTTAACGDKKPPATPSADVDASAPDMPSTSSTGDAGDTTAATPPPDTTPTTPPAPAALALPSGSAKIALKGKKPGAVEIKSDGSVTNGGKPVGKVSGMALQNADGKTLLSVGSDGAVTAGDAGTAYGSFSGDDLTLAKGDKLTIGDDGAVTWTTGAKGTPLGKFDGVGSAKRAALLAVAFIAAPPAAEKPAAAATPAAKPAGKPKKK